MGSRPLYPWRLPKWLFALRDGYHNWNHNQSRKSRRVRGHSRPSLATDLSTGPTAGGPATAVGRHHLRRCQQHLDGGRDSGQPLPSYPGGDQRFPGRRHSEHRRRASTPNPSSSPRAVNLLGPNAGINPNSATRTPEAVVVPPVNAPASGVIVLVKANNVTIDGLTIDGHNDALTAGTLLNGVSSNASTGDRQRRQLGSTSPSSPGSRPERLIKDLTLFGVIGDINDFSTSKLAVSTGNAIRNNQIDNIPTRSTAPSPGRGISIEDNFYADVTGNVLTRVATGIQAIFFLTPAGPPPRRSATTPSTPTTGILLHTLDTDTPAFAVRATRSRSSRGRTRRRPTRAWRSRGLWAPRP